MTADDVEAALATTTAALGASGAGDWSVRAGDLRWSCRRTAVHLADCLFAYAAQVVARPADHWVPSSLSAPRATPPAGLLELIGASGGILAAAVRCAPPTVRAWHPYGTSDPEGFAAMAVIETLIHGADIADGLSIAFAPPSDLCSRTLMRLFPDVEPHDDPWELLRWSTGRIALPHRPRRRAWRWTGAPLT